MTGRILTPIAIVLLCVAAAGCGTGKDVTVASVAGIPIGSKLLDHWTAVDLGTGTGADTRSERAARREMLALLILWKWTTGEARASHVRVTAAEARKQLSLSQTSLNGGIGGFEWFQGESGLKRLLVKPNVAPADRLTLVKMGMLAARLAARRAAIAASRVPRGRVLAYYDRHRGRFRVGERRDIKAIMNKDRAKTVEARREMERGVRFHLIEERFNQSVEGGLRLGRARGTQQKRYEKDYFAVPPHHLVGPLHEILYYVFEVLSVRPGYQRTLAEVEPTIRQRLAAQSAVPAATRAYERRWRERTVCRTGYTTARCGGYSATPR